MRFFNNGSPADSFSPLTAAGTVSYAEIAEPYHLDYYARLGGALYLSMGLFVQFDLVEPMRGFGGGGSAGAAKATNFRDGLGRPDCFGRQVVVADCEDSDIASTQVAYKYFAGVFTGLVATATGGYGYNMPAATATAANDSAATNGFTTRTALTPCVDPLHGGRSYAKPGDIIAVRRRGPVIGWVSDTNSTVANSLIGFLSAVDTPQDGVAFLTAGSAIGVVHVAPDAFDTTGADQGCPVMLGL